MGKNLAGDGGGTLLKWHGGEGTTRRNSAMGLGPNRQAAS
jgi:hypothetical protein